MPIDASGAVQVFLLPHQDDEFGVFGVIENCVARSARPVCVFLTGGQAGAASGPRRDAESRSVLSRLGVRADDIRFLGSDMRIPDGELHRHLGQVYPAVLAVLADLRPAKIYVPAWEGGHHDHDVTHALGVLACDALGLAPPSQFPLYNGVGLPGPLFWVLHTLPANGAVRHVRFGLRRACRYVLLCLSYRSQWRTWIGLLPFVTLVTLFRRGHVLQPTEMHRLEERPHSGALFYERRFGVEYVAVAAAVADLMRRREDHVARDARRAQ